MKTNGTSRNRLAFRAEAFLVFLNELLDANRIRGIQT